MTNKISFPVSVCRKISTTEDEKQGITIYVGQSPINAFLHLPDEENVRKYTVESGKRKRKSGVHMAIYDTLSTNPEKFFVLNGGICIVAKQAVPSNDQKCIELIDPSIINGSQTRGVIKEFLEENIDSDPINAKFEIIVTRSQELITEASIARNNQIAVKQISILGARDVFNEMDERIKEEFNGKQLRKSETDRDEEIFVPTEKLIQVIAALIPECLWSITGRKTNFSKVFAYTSMAGPLKMFEDMYNFAKTGKNNGGSDLSEKQISDAIELYNFYLDIAPEALRLYEKWHSGKPFEGHNWKQQEAVVRDSKTREILKSHDGIIFPIIASYSAFIKKSSGKWIIEIPNICDDNKIINAARIAFNNAYKKPNVMGKSEASYTQIYSVTETIAQTIKELRN